jgi:hypothetical protein
MSVYPASLTYDPCHGYIPFADAADDDVSEKNIVDHPWVHGCGRSTSCKELATSIVRIRDNPPRHRISSSIRPPDVSGRCMTTSCSIHLILKPRRKK